jgi:hypothetical protein
MKLGDTASPVFSIWLLNCFMNIGCHYSKLCIVFFYREISLYLHFWKFCQADCGNSIS